MPTDSSAHPGAGFASADLPRERDAVACRICGNKTDNRLHTAKEMMFGMRDMFTYAACSQCGCLALIDVPADLRKYYPPTYCSFRARESGIRGLAKKIRARSYFQSNALGSWIAKRYPRPDLAAMAKFATDKNLRILDVGCGEGKILLELNSLGYKHLTGIDPFIEKDIDYGNGLQVRKSALTELVNSGNSQWDLITFHHSFEHVPDQHETLAAASRLLAPKGRCMVRIPVLGLAWEKYGTNWVQLDPPRHFFLHTERSMQHLAKTAGLETSTVEYDSMGFQFWGSELYARGTALRTEGVPRKFFSAARLDDFERESQVLNTERRGDQAIFILRKS